MLYRTATGTAAEVFPASVGEIEHRELGRKDETSPWMRFFSIEMVGGGSCEAAVVPDFGVAAAAIC